MWKTERLCLIAYIFRYCDTLGNVVDRIYTKMDLLLFADEDESPNHLLNSEDSNQSWRDRQHGDVWVKTFA